MKSDPYHVTNATPYEKESINVMMDLAIKDHGDYVKKAFMAITIFTSMRSQDCHTLRSKGCSFVPATKDNPRHYSFVLDRIKNDPSGSGPVDGRTFLCPCICMKVMEDKDKKLMLKDLKKDPLCACWTPCPFNVIRQYLEVIPDPFGAEMEAERLNNVKLQPLPFFRSQNTVGRRLYLRGPLGINSLYNIGKYINGRLPQSMQIDRPTGHSGRHTFISHAINSGVDAQVVAKASKHKDVNCVQKYYRESTSSKLLPALCIGAVDEKEDKDSLATCSSVLDNRPTVGSGSSFDMNSSNGKCCEVLNSCTSSSMDCVPTSSNDGRGIRSLHSSKRHRKCVESSSSCSSDDDFVVPDKKKKKPKGFSFNMWF